MNLPSFLRQPVNFPFQPNLCKFPRFLTIFPIFSENDPDFPKNRVCVNFKKNLRECVNFEIFLRECVNFGFVEGQVFFVKPKKIQIFTAETFFNNIPARTEDNEFTILKGDITKSIAH